MGKVTGIEWCTATWNPWYGCDPVSPGCAHCYMFRDMRQYGRDPETVTRSKTTFRDPLRWKAPERIFTCSWSDWFHEDADAWRPEAWEIIRATPHHTYLILTKRIERARDHLPPDWGDGWPNVWLGTSVENQRWTTRIPMLLEAPAAVRFLSCEPLLGPIDFDAAGSLGAEYGDPFAFSALTGADGCEPPIPGIDWVIVGGESGADHRPCDVGWIEDIVAQCDFAGVPVFVKQDSGPKPGRQGRIPHDVWAFKQFPAAAGGVS